MENQKPGAQQKSLSLVYISSAFICLGFGLGFAFIVFLIELIISKGRIIFKKRTKNDSSNKQQSPVIKAAEIEADDKVAASEKETLIIESVGEEENLYGIAPFVGTILIDVVFLNDILAISQGASSKWYTHLFA